MNTVPSPMPARVLIVNEPIFGSRLTELLRHAGLDAVSAQTGYAALRTLEQQRSDAVVLDDRLQDMSGLDLLHAIRRRTPQMPAVMLTDHPDVQGAICAMRDGVQDYISKSVDDDVLVRAVRTALTSGGGRSGEPSVAASLCESMGPSEAVARLVARIGLVAKSTFSVLILGESGAGKVLVARAIHRSSGRRAAPFVAIDCGAIPEQLLESELYGYEKGAFTGAAVAKSGKFSAANYGTLFLDEIANLPLASQAKLLRVIQERTLYRVGGNTPLPLDVRIVAATNEDIEQKALDGGFRRDLFFRLSEFVIHVPALRERRDDILYLARHFATQTCTELDKSPVTFSDATCERLLNHPWPGNVRQLRNTIRQAVLVAGDIVQPAHLNIASSGKHAAPAPEFGWEGLSLKEVVRRNIADIERRVIEQVLQATHGNKAQAARVLQVDYKTIHSKVKEYRIEFRGVDDEDQA
ncbi:Fis family transcriptional regulator [Burkholderia mayonis]|uniref:Fis family transcriptional regulator n=1 Tax=Burkholderia mayonis TaxID=1385591 RepID=A0A1B4FN40_9BURK|nr:sigma-54 dependent transcriptional regulator [Burkholderia mayonis]AOJ05079.1 Fis family transcriptional regulator [Burkholderia mayonis]KVE41669.1 Fis family transcriptional regulator [Burkholderia mayonis]